MQDDDFPRYPERRAAYRRQRILSKQIDQGLFLQREKRVSRLRAGRVPRPLELAQPQNARGLDYLRAANHPPEPDQR